MTLKYGLEIIQGDWNWYHSKARVRFSICLWRYLVSFSRYSDSQVENREIFILHLYLALWLVIAIPEIPISGFPEIPFFPKSRNSGIFQAKIPEIRDFHFLHYLL